MQPSPTTTLAAVSPLHHRLLRCLALTGLALSVLGCGDAPPAVETQPVEPEPQIVVVDDATERFGAPPEPDVEQPPTVDVAPAVETVSASPLAAPQADAPQTSERDVKEEDVPDDHIADVAADGQSDDAASRLWLPTSAGLLLVDLDIRIGDQPIAAHFEQYLTDIETAARGEADILKWSDLQAFVSSHPRRFGRMIQSSNDMTERYDANKNETVERDELRKFLFRGSARDAAVSVDSHDRFRQRNRRESPIFTALDRDANQQLDRQETAQAAERLLRLDRNFDQRLDAGEPAEEPINASMSDSRSRTFGPTANVLSEFNNWQRLSYALGGLVEKRPFATGNLLIELDQDQNGELSRDEAQTLQTMTPDLRLQIQLAIDQSEPARLTLASTAATLNAIIDETPSRVTLSDAALELRVRVADVVSQRAMIPLQAFKALDADRNGLLSKKEIPPRAADQISFDEFDVNQDGGLTMAEINAGLRGDAPAWMAQVRVDANESSDAWFVWLDANRDDYLSTREIETAGERLARLDRNGDGNLQWDEVPDAYDVKIIRSDPEDPNAEARLSATLPSPLPNWAAQLDQNADTEVSWHEFIGTRSQFNQLDANQDGYITANEIP